MSTSITVRRFLDKQDVRYASIAVHDEFEEISQNGTKSIKANQVAKAVILKDLRGMLMAVLPGPNNLDVDALNRQLHRNLAPAPSEDYKGIFADCSPAIIPPLGEAYGFETIIDDGLLDKELIYFASGNPNELVRISGHDFQLLHSNAWYGNTFSHIVDDSDHESAAENQLDSSAIKIKQKIQQTTNLPAMPGMARKIIQLNTNPYAHAEDLAKLIEKDPSLAAQVIRYAQSPLYGYRGKIASVRQAISRVLGYDLVMNIALGIAATRPFKIASDGPLGLHAYWRHATYSATLSQGLCNCIPKAQRPNPGTAYLCGLLHNFGFLLLGYLFPDEFATLNTAIRKDPDTAILAHEQALLDVTHNEIGKWLMESWNLPQEIIVSVTEHHNENYTGRHAEYASLVLLSNKLLKSHNIGDADNDDIKLAMLESLGISEDQAYSVLEKTLEGREDLESMARQLAA